MGAGELIEVVSASVRAEGMTAWVEVIIVEGIAELLIIAGMLCSIDRGPLTAGLGFIHFNLCKVKHYTLAVSDGEPVQEITIRAFNLVLITGYHNHAAAPHGLTKPTKAHRHTPRGNSTITHTLATSSVLGVKLRP